VMDKRIVAAVTVLAQPDHYHDELNEVEAWVILLTHGINLETLPDEVTALDLIAMADARWRRMVTSWEVA
jgi:hypothetical protein